MQKTKLSKAHLDEFQKLLSEREQALVEEASRTRGTFEVEREAPADPNDKASDEFDQSFEFRIRGREHKLINKVREALERIREGTFGICSECGEMISVERLRARPVTDLCIACKEEQELTERMNLA